MPAINSGHGDAEVQQDDPHRRIVRIGDTVRRPTHPWSATIHELLRYLESVGFPYSPRVLRVDDRTETLTYLDGDSGPAGWHRVVHDDGLVAMARLLRDYHQAIEGFRPAADVAWAGRTGAPTTGEVVCHGDFGPWNLVWRGNRPVGILDWDYAWPQPRIHDVAYALEYVTPFRDDAESLRWFHHPTPPDRRARLERFAEAYGLTTTEGLVDAVIDQQQLVLDRVRTLAAEGREPQRGWLADGTVEQQAKHVDWSRRHRHLRPSAGRW
jgi:hypothetical protein